MTKKVLAVFFATSLFITNLSASDLLLPESRLAPAQSPQLLENMKFAVLSEFIKVSRAVLFVPQEFITSDGCAELVKRLPHIQFVQFNQYTRIENLSGMLRRYPPQFKKIVITVGLDFSDIRRTVEENQGVFKNVIAINLSSRGLSDMRGAKRRIYQRSVLALALLAASLPKEGYRGAIAYPVFRSLLEAVLPSGADLDRYIDAAVNTDRNTTERFMEISNQEVEPAAPIDSNTRFRRTVETFI